MSEALNQFLEDNVPSDELSPEEQENQEVEQEEEQEQEQEAESERELSPIEQEAVNMGWKPDFDGPEKETAHSYVRYGKIQHRLAEEKKLNDRRAHDYEVNIKQLNKFHEMQMDAKIKDLENQRRDAVDVADVEEYDRLNIQIDAATAEKASTNQPVAAESVEAEKPQLIKEWEERNKWFADDADPKQYIARGAYDQYVSRHPDATIEQALSFVDSEIEKVAPKKTGNPRRNSPTSTESSSIPRAKSTRSLSMSDLTRQEERDWNAFGKDAYTEKEFLEAVKNSRVK
jgi:hypothetical protein